MSSQVEGGDTESVKAGDSSAGEEGVKVDVPEEGSEVWQQAEANLLNGFQNLTHQLSIPCFVSSSAPSSNLDFIPYRYDTLSYSDTPDFHSPFSQTGGHALRGGRCSGSEAITSDHLKWWK